MRFNNTCRALMMGAVLCFCSCEAQLGEVCPDVNNGVEYTITADCSGTKTVNNGLATDWESTDKLSVIYPSEYTLATTCFSNQGGNTFKGIVVKPTHPGTWYAIYPYEENLLDPAALKITFPEEAVQTGNGSMEHLAGNGFHLWGKTASDGEIPDITMHQFAGVIKFIVTNAEQSPIVIRNISFNAPTPIAGQFNADITGDIPTLSVSENNGINTVSLTVNSAESIPYGESASFYIGVKPFSAEGSYSISITALIDNEEKTYSSSSEGIQMVMAAGQITPITCNFDLPDSEIPEITEAHYELVTSEPTNWEGTYLIVNSANEKVFKPIAGNTGNSANVTVENGIIIADDTVNQYAITVTDAGEVHPASPEGLEAYDLRNPDGLYMMWSSSNLCLESTINHKNKGVTYTYHHTLKYDNGVQVVSAQIQASSTNIYYMTFSGSVFTYQANSSANRVNLYKYVSGTQGDNPGQPDTPGPDQPDPDDPDEPQQPEEPSLTEVNQGTFELVNDGMRTFIADAEAQYTDSNRKTVSLVTTNNRSKYGFGGNGDLYQSGENIMANDRPLPVTLTLDSSLNGSNVSVTVYNDAAKTDVENTVSGTVSNAKFEIYNLIPNRTYWYTVNMNSDAVAIGYFQTTGTRRIIKVSDTIYADNANNCRDLGGIPTVDGGYIKYGKLFRGTNLDETTAAEKAILTGYLNIGHDVDLRGATSDKSRNIARQIISNISYDAQKYSGASDLLVGSKINATFTSIVNALNSGKASYIHCFAGADRTGYVCSLLLALCGVSSKEITIDYELTSFSCVDLRDRSGKVKNEAFAKNYPTLEGYTGSTLKQKAENLLKSYGITDAQISAFRAAMVEYPNN